VCALRANARARAETRTRLPRRSRSQRRAKSVGVRSQKGPRCQRCGRSCSVRSRRPLLLPLAHAHLSHVTCTMCSAREARTGCRPPLLALARGRRPHAIRSQVRAHVASSRAALHLTPRAAHSSTGSTTSTFSGRICATTVPAPLGESRAARPTHPNPRTLSLCNRLRVAAARTRHCGCRRAGGGPDCLPVGFLSLGLRYSSRSPLLLHLPICPVRPRYAGTHRRPTFASRYFLAVSVCEALRIVCFMVTTVPAPAPHCERNRYEAAGRSA
jgi:hypothetical protein